MMGNTFKQAEERISELEFRTTEMIESEEQKGKIKVNRDQHIWGIASNGQYVYYGSPKEEKEKGQREYLKK